MEASTGRVAAPQESFESFTKNFPIPTVDTPTQGPLHVAARAKNVDVVRCCLKKGIEPLQKDELECTYLSLLAEAFLGKTKIRASRNECNDFTKTAVSIGAISEAEIQVFDVLMREIFADGPDDETNLKKYIDEIEQKMDGSPNVILKLTELLQPARLAVRVGKFQLAAYFLSRGSPSDFPSVVGAVSLHSRGNDAVGMFKQKLSHESWNKFLESRMIIYGSILECASRAQNTDLLVALVNHGAKITSEAIFGAIRCNSKTCLDKIVELATRNDTSGHTLSSLLNAKICRTEFSGGRLRQTHQTPLIAAVWHNRLDMAKRLIELGADAKATVINPSTWGNYAHSALTCLLSNNYGSACIQTFVRDHTHMANLHRYLEEATMCNNDIMMDIIIRMLLQKGTAAGDIKRLLTQKRGAFFPQNQIYFQWTNKTPLDVARIRHSRKIVSILENLDAFLQVVQDPQGQKTTPYALAQKERIEMLRTLLQLEMPNLERMKDLLVLAVKIDLGDIVDELLAYAKGHLGAKIAMDLVQKEGVFHGYPQNSLLGIAVRKGSSHAVRALLKYENPPKATTQRAALLEMQDARDSLGRAQKRLALAQRCRNLIGGDKPQPPA